MSYMPHQANEILHLLDFEPLWMIDCGPGDGHEWERFLERWPNIRLIGLEPSPVAYGALLGRFPGTLFNAAAWSRDCLASFLNPGSLLQGRLADVDTSSFLGPSLVDWPVLEQETIMVSCLRLDSLGPMENAFLWADVEGAEMDVLIGAERLLQSGTICGLNLEVHDGHREAEIDAHLMASGYIKRLSYAHNGAHHGNLYLRG